MQIRSSIHHPLLSLAFCMAAAAQTGPKVEFEVASAKLSPTAQARAGMQFGCHGGPGTSDLGLFTCSLLSLRQLIVRAYSLPQFQVSAPDWTQTQRFEIKATVPPGTTKEQCNVMLQNLLIDRFKLSVHREPRELSRYELVVAAGGPKFKEAKEPTEESASPAAPPQAQPNLKPSSLMKMPTDKDGYPIPTWTVPGFSRVNGRGRYYQPTGTMQGLLNFLSMQMDKPVVDATGLKGNYELSF